MVVRINKQHPPKTNLLACLIMASTVSVQAETKTQDSPIAKINRLEQALDARNQGKTYQSIELLEELVDQAPAHARLRLELAKSYYQAYQYDQAEAEVEQVLSSNKTSNVARTKSQQFLDKINNKQLQAQDQRHNFRGGIKVFAGNDSNANAAPADNDFEEGSLPDSSISKEDTFRGASFTLKHRYQFEGSYNIANKPATLAWQSGFKVSDKNYKDIDSSDLTVASLSTGLTLSQRRNWSTGIKTKAEYIRLGGEDLAYYTSIIPTYTYYFEHASITLTPTYTHRDYVDSSDAGKEGHRSGATLSFTQPLAYDITMRLGLTAATTDLEDDWRSYDSAKYSLRILKKFSPELSLSFSSSYEDKQYDALAVNYTRERHDKTVRAGLGLKYKLTPNLALGLKYSFTERDSNQDIRSYERNRLEASIGYNF
jgi:Tfp pilus assembly protein PilF